MKKFAVLSGDTVSNIIVAESLEIAQSIVPGPIEVDDSVAIGSKFNSETRLFEAVVGEEIA